MLPRARSTPSGVSSRVLQEAQQLGLQLGRHLADLVEEQRAALGLLDQPGAWPLGAVRVRAARVAEQLALDQLARAAPRS